MSARTREFVVATFCDPGETRRSKVRAYTRWYSERWADCIEFTVSAASGTEAKKLAIAKRLEHEAKGDAP